MSSARAAEPADRPLAWTRVRKFVAGYASGVSLVLAGHPFDTIKVCELCVCGCVR